mgnify:CR=1 FL=1
MNIIMKIKELFTIGDMIQSIGGLSTFLDRDNCQIVNKTKNENAVVLILRRQSDGEEGRVYLRIRNEFSIITNQLLGWAFMSERILGLTLNQLSETETGLQISSLNGNITLKQE